MGCRNRVLSEDEGAFSASFSDDALIFTTMCIIGLRVDVHVKDGSIYSGIFHTACIENDYAIVLKKARMTRNGNCVPNVPNDSQIETLIVMSDDLVQVVAKGVVLPAMDGVSRNVASDCTGAVAGTVPSVSCSEKEPKLTMSSNSHVDMNHISQTRSSSLVENGFSLCNSSKAISSLSDSLGVGNGKLDDMDSSKKEGAFTGSVNERQTGDDRLQEKQSDHRDDFQKEQTRMQRDDIQSSNSSSDACENLAKAVKTLDAKTTGTVLPNIALCDNSASLIKKIGNDVQRHQTYSPENNFSSDAISSGVSTSVASVMDVTSEQCFNLSSSSDNAIPPKTTSSIRTAKESKLNPGAKIFSPSFAHHRSTTPPVIPTIAGVTYLPDNCSVIPITAAQPEVEISPFLPCSVFPVKFVPYGNMVAGNSGSDVQYSQPIVGHMENRTQPVRYAGQYHPVQVGAAYAHQNNQNVMVGRASPLVYVHPVSNDVQNTAALSQVSVHPGLTLQQTHLSKQQDNGAAPALQLYIAPQFFG